MIDFIRQHRRVFLLLTLAGIALRLFFIWKFPVAEGDTLIYGDIAKNWLDHGIFGQTIDGAPEPTLIRLPGYPAFLAICFAILGRDHYTAVRMVQLLIDLGSCLLVADLARRLIGDRAALVAFAMAMLCPFTANYVALPLAETPSIFFTVLAFWFAVCGLDGGGVREWVGCGAVCGAAILMRPDNALVMVVVCGYVLLHAMFASHSTNVALSGAPGRGKGTAEAGSGKREQGTAEAGTGNREQGTEELGAAFKSKIRSQKSELAKAVLAVALVGLVSLAPLVPWTIRNWRVFHVFQPLSARYANNPDEDPHLGFQQWTKTWMGEYVSVVEVYWHVTGEEVKPELLPSRAFDTPEERERTVAIFEAYNESNTLPAALDQQLGQLARERKQRHPFRYYVTLPLARIADMWLRPRTEMIGIMERWWEYETDPVDFWKALLYACLNALYLPVALWGMIMRRREVRYAGMLIAFLVVRSLFLGTLENPEPRYTLEMFPVVFVFGAAALAGMKMPFKSKTLRP